MDINIESDYPINANYTNRPLTSITRQYTFYLPLCNHSPKIHSNPLFLNVLPRLQMPRFICNHLPPLFYSSPRRRRSWWLQVSTYKLGWQINLYLQPYLPPCNLRSISVLRGYLSKGCRWQMKMKTIFLVCQTCN